jgi:hypothetical protein
MDLQQLVHASEILENLESIENQILHENKKLTENGVKMIDEIIKDCCDALSNSCDCDDRGKKEFDRINTMILEICMRIKRSVDSNVVLEEVLA